MSKTTDFILELEAKGLSDYVENPTLQAPAPVRAVFDRFMKTHTGTLPTPEKSNWLPPDGHPFWLRNPLPF